MGLVLPFETPEAPLSPPPVISHLVKNRPVSPVSPLHNAHVTLLPFPAAPTETLSEQETDIHLLEQLANSLEKIVTRREQQGRPRRPTLMILL